MWWLVACAAPEPASLGPDGGAEDATARAPLQLRFPLLERERFEQTVGVDHDPAVYGEGAAAVQCVNYDGRSFPWCYDEHDGSDYLLLGGFETMDAGSATVVAAADGVVVDTLDGNYDRCHATVDGVDCDGWPMVANYVIVEHPGGWTTRYWHLRNGSVSVAAGDPVLAGHPLGEVGSSGYSSAPHLHFELQEPDGLARDPYAGERSQPETWWCEQGPPEGLPGSDCGDADGR
jgi:hypothetical protein